MKKLFGGLLVLGLVFGVSFYVGKGRRIETAAETVSLPWTPSLYPLINRPFVVVIVGRNNGAWLEKTLASALKQNYPNYRVVYVDDGSEDHSFSLAEQLAKESGMQVELLRNEVALGTVVCLDQVVRSCRADEIVVVVGERDWLAHEWVLSRLNQYYANPSLWMAYGQYREYPSYAMGIARFESSLQSFYAHLYQRILPGSVETNAESYMLPMLEMAGTHAAFIPDILYIARENKGR